MCNSEPGSFDMRNLLHAGMLFDTLYSLAAEKLVSFVDNHDTGKESDKWLLKNWDMAYAYIFFAPPQPCVFYNHFFGDMQKEYYNERKELSIPSNLKAEIIKLMNLREDYLSGQMNHVSDNSDRYRNLYIAFREGNESCSGAFLSLNNGSSENDPERETVLAALQEANGVVTRAAALLGMSRQALYRRMERLGVSLERRLRDRA